jgi:hypothetical protein
MPRLLDRLVLLVLGDDVAGHVDAAREPGKLLNVVDLTASKIAHRGFLTFQKKTL